MKKKLALAIGVLGVFIIGSAIFAYSVPKNPRTAPEVVTEQSVAEEVVVEEPEDTLEPTVIFDLVNEHRASIGLGALTWDDRLAKSAELKCLDIRNNDNFSHTNSDGTEPWEFFRQAGITSYELLGENLLQKAAFDSQEEPFVEQWLDSPGHRKQIETPRYTHSAVSVCKTKPPLYFYYAVQHFASY